MASAGSVLITQNGYAAPDDWDKYRPVITNLYRTRPLRSVMQIMRDDYHFHGTVRMYKFRLKKWGLFKYNPRNKTKAIEKTISISGHEHTSLVFRGNGPIVVDITHDDNYSLVQISADSATNSSRESSPGSIPFLIESPEPVRRPEWCMHLLGQYISGGFDMGLWARAPEAKTTVLDISSNLSLWLTNFTTGLQLLQHRQTKKAFRSFHTGFETFEGQLRTQDPRLLVYIFIIAVYASDFAPEVGQSILKYAATLSRTVFGSSLHPFHQFLVQVCRMSFTDFILNARYLVEYYLVNLRAQVDVGCNFWVQINQMHAWTTMILSMKKLMDLDTAESMFEQIDQRYVQDVPNDRSSRLRSQLYLVNMYEERDVFDKGQGKAFELLALDDIQEHPTYIIYLNTCLVTMARKMSDRTLLLKAADVLQTLFRARPSEGEVGPITVFIELESALRELGEIEAADDVRRDLDRFVEKTHSGGVGEE